MKRPNILYIYPDQMRYDCSSFAGNPVVKTPAFDALAAGGAYYERAYTSFPLCCPYRASLMTGKYAHSNGMCTNHFPIQLNQTFLPQLMKDAGYYTGWIGKWHLNGGNKFDFVPPEYQLGFDRFIGFSRGHRYIDGMFYRDFDPTPRCSDKFEPEYQTDHLIEFMEDAQEQGKPFLAMISYGIPHSPVEMAPEHYKHMYAPEDVQLPDWVPEWMREKDAAYRAMYYGLITCFDDQLKRITEYLKEKDLFDDTVIIICSDHGDLNGDHGLEYKSSFHDGSAHVPLLISYPRMVKAGTRVTQLVDPSVDLTPTILNFAGAEVPAEMQGRSLVASAVEGHDADREDMVYYELLKVSDEGCRILDIQERKPFPERGIRTSKWLYVEKCGIPFALYDLERDPNELYNMVNNCAYYDQMLELREQLRRQMEKTDDSWDIAAPAPSYYQTHAAGEAFYKETFAKAVKE